MAEINGREWSGPDADPLLPSGSEVHSAAFVVAVPVEEVPASLRDRVLDLKAKGVRKVETLKSDGVRRIHHARSRAIDTVNVTRTKVSDNLLLMRAKARIRVASLQRNARLRGAQLKQGMRTDTGKWAGVAAGTGLAVGLLGRIMRHRAKIRREMLRTPQLVIIEGSC